jgi:hypothetical protein
MHVINMQQNSNVSKKQQIINKVLQPDIVINLETCLDAYKDQNNLTDGQVCVCL